MRGRDHTAQRTGKAVDRAKPPVLKPPPALKLPAVQTATLPNGLTLAVVHLIGIPLTGTGVNPARSFGPAVFAGSPALTQVWLFLVAPLVGGDAAAIGQRAQIVHMREILAWKIEPHRLCAGSKQQVEHVAALGLD